MPNYDYICDHCKKTFEFHQSMKDEPFKECPSCHNMSLRRLIGTGAGIIFKGSGFYETDYKRSSASSSSASSTKEKDKGSCGGGCACHPKTPPSKPSE